MKRSLVPIWLPLICLLGSTAWAEAGDSRQECRETVQQACGAKKQSDRLECIESKIETLEPECAKLWQTKLGKKKEKQAPLLEPIKPAKKGKKKQKS